MKRRSTQRIAVILEGRVQYERNVLRGIREFAVSRDRWLVRLEMPGQQTARFIEQWNPHGILFQSAGLDAKTVTRIVSREHAIHLSESPSKAVALSVGLDNWEIGQLGAQYFLERGFRSFAFAGFQKTGFSRSRGNAFSKTVRESGYRIRRLNLSGEPDDVEVIDWLRGLPKPCGLFATHDECGLYLLTLGRSVDLRIPEDIAILGVDNDTLVCELAWPQLSSVAVPSQRVGWEAARWLDQLLKPSQKATPDHQSRLLPPVGIETRHSTEILRTEDESVNRALRYIQLHFQSRINVEDILQNTGTSRRMLERKFGQQLGRTPLQELQRVRIDAAARLLQETSLPQRKIAAQCGCRDASQLITLFRKQRKMTPGEFRKKRRSV